jgi:hypothetical protein
MSSLIKLCRYLAGQDKKHVATFVTISRQAGAGGITIGEKLAALLTQSLSKTRAWPVFDKLLVDEVIKDHKLPERVRAVMKEDYVPAIEEHLNGFLGVNPPRSTLVERTNQTMQHLARMGGCIIVGRGGSEATQLIPGGVHIRLVGSIEKRTAHLAQHFKWNERKSKEFLVKEDRGRALYLKKYFSQDIDNPVLYDLVINTDSISYDEAAILIKDLVMMKITKG